MTCARLQIETIPDRLRRLNDEDLVAHLQLSVQGERRMTIQVIHDLNEMRRRRLYLDLGYSSLFQYCVRKLGYSASAAGRRIQAARCIRRFPEVLDLLQIRDLSLSTISLIEPILTDENKDSVLVRVRGASHREVERVVAEYRPPIRFRDRVRPVRVAMPAPPNVDAVVLDREIARATPGAGSGRTVIKEKLLVQFLADEEFMKVFEEVRGLLSNRDPEISFAEVVKVALAEFRDRHNPSARAERREARNGRSSPDSRRRESSAANPSVRSRHIPAAVKDQVFARDSGECSFVAHDGTKCRSNRGIQVDHIHPFALGGSSALSNLRLLCAAHNRRAAEQVMGEQVMRPFYRRE